METRRSRKKVSNCRQKRYPKANQKKQVQKPNIFQISAQFLRDARTELRKVKWPTKKELIASTIMVIVLVLFVALYLGLVDIGLTNIIKRIVG